MDVKDDTELYLVAIEVRHARRVMPNTGERIAIPRAEVEALLYPILDKSTAYQAIELGLEGAGIDASVSIYLVDEPLDGWLCEHEPAHSQHIEDEAANPYEMRWDCDPRCAPEGATH